MANTNINRASILNLDSSTTGTVLAKGTTAERPSSSIPDGAFRFNTTLNKLEYYDGSNWYTIDDEAAPGSTPNALNNFETKLYTGNGVTQSIGGYINGAGSFDGSSSLMTITDGGIGASSTARVTLSVSLWIKTTASNQSNIISDYGTNYAFYIQMESSASGGAGKLSVANNYTGGLIYTTAGTVAINDGNWHHLVLVNDTSNNTQKFYLDGITTPVISQSLGSGTKTVNPITVGYYTGYIGTYNFEGTIDQIRFYNTALTTSNITALYNETASTASTAAYPSGQTATATYTMDTSANGLLTTTDLSTVNYPAGAGCIALYEMNGNADDANNTYDGTPTNITYQGGAFDQAAVFNGTNSVIDTNFTSNSGDFSCSLWSNITNDNTRHALFSLHSGSGATSTVLYSPLSGSDGRWYFNSKNTNAFYGPSIKFGQWQHVVLTYQQSNTTFTLYIDGVSVGTSVSSIASGQKLLIGDVNTSGSISAIKGLVDQVRIFNTALTQSQVTTLARGIATSYSGSATNVNFNGSLNFQPDLVWVKARDAAHDHVLVNSINGAGSNQGLSSNATYYNGQYTATYGYISSLNSNGFTVSAGSSYANYTNVNNEDYVSWNWKAGGAAVTNNNGTLTSTVNVNQSAGFSIVKYTGNTTAGATVGHGLSTKPQFILFKGLDATISWIAYDTINNVIGYLDLPDSLTDGRRAWAVNNTDPTATLVTLGNNNATNPSTNMIMYCWHSVAGFSKIDSYNGSGVSGREVALDFNPSFVLIKRINNSTGWVIVDSKRGTAELYPNLPNSEDATATNIVLGTNKFTLNSVGSWYNASGGNYLYMAFA